MKERDISLDIIRCLACVMVIVMHSPMPNIGTPGIVLSAVSLLTVPCIGLFFMVSGALLLPANGDAKGFLSRRFSKILCPTLFWTLFYIAVKAINSRTIDCFDLTHQLLSMPFSAQGHGVMWFMYVLSGLYLLTPILSPWIRSATKRELQFYLMLWFVAMSYPIIRNFIAINDSPTGILYYFSGYAGYFVLGYYLNRYPISRGYSVILFPIPILAAVCCKVLHLEVDFYQVLGYLSVLTVMTCVAWFTLIYRLPIIGRIRGCLKRLIIDFSNCSFGIYLSHIFIMRHLLWQNVQMLKLGGGSSDNSYFGFDNCNLFYRDKAYSGFTFFRVSDRV